MFDINCNKQIFMIRTSLHKPALSFSALVQTILAINRFNVDDEFGENHAQQVNVSYTIIIIDKGTKKHSFPCRRVR